MAEKPSLSPLLGLPAECILLILHHVECPRTLASLRRVSRHIYELLSDTGRASDEAIWRPSANYLLREFCPKSLDETLESSWQAYVRRTVTLSQVPPAVPPKPILSFKRPTGHSDNESDSETEEDVRQPARYKPSLVSTTECGPRFLGEDVPGLEVDYTQALPEIPCNAEIQFLHSASEAHRAHGIPIPFCTVNGRFVTFSDEATNWEFSPRDHAHLVVDPKHSNPFRVMDDENIVGRLQEVVGEIAMTCWIQSSLLSDSDLVLIPKELSIKDQQDFVERRPMIEKVRRLALDGEKEVEWDLSSMTSWRQYCLDPDLKPRRPEDLYDHEFEFRQTTWEFRSAGDCLVVADDNNGSSPTTLTCFSAEKTDGPVWQRIMMDTVEDPNEESGLREIFYDNDGFKVTPTFIIYATRAHLTRGMEHFYKKNTVAAEFHLLSPENGDTIRTLAFDPEVRRLDKRCYMSTSFTVSDSLVVATMAGEARRNSRYRWREALVWDLTDKADERQKPAATIPLPTWWEDDYQDSQGMEVYTQISPDGRLILFTAGWEAQVWDWENKECIGHWEVHNNEAWEMRNEMEPDEFGAVEGWNGVWVAYYHDELETAIMKQIEDQEKRNEAKLTETAASTSTTTPEEAKKKTPVKHNDCDLPPPPATTFKTTVLSRELTLPHPSTRSFNLAYFPATHIRAAIHNAPPPHPAAFDEGNWPPVPPDADWADYNGPELAHAMLQYALGSGLLAVDDSHGEDSENDSDISSNSSHSDSSSEDGEDGDGGAEDSDEGSNSGSSGESGSGRSDDDDDDGGQMEHDQEEWAGFPDDSVNPDGEGW